jgi:hypothetical protein
MPKKPSFIDVFPGAAPVAAVYATLGIEMDEGDVKCSAQALHHASRRHPQDVPVILPHLSEIIRNPLYMGDDFKNPGKIELIGKIAGRSGAALVALTIAMDEADGYYHVCSMYMITQSELDRKRDKLVLKIAKV